MTLNWLFTLRGMPQLYYGTEVLMKNYKVNTDATVREDFPGGWPSDDVRSNRFIKEGRTISQDSTYNYISQLAGFRKSSSALITGRLIQRQLNLVICYLISTLNLMPLERLILV